MEHLQAAACHVDYLRLQIFLWILSSFPTDIDPARSDFANLVGLLEHWDPADMYRLH